MKIFQNLRRVVFLTLVLVTTLAATSLLQLVFQQDGLTSLEVFLLFLYFVLFTWVSVSFWTAGIGFVICLFRIKRFSIANHTKADVDPHQLSKKTAIIMPVYNEDPHRVFAGLKTIMQSLEQYGTLPAFDFFVLSDTQDPDIWVEEELRWHDLNRWLNGKTNLFYRNRQRNHGRKSGNIQDFCERWGTNYEYMIVLDADSIMGGRTLSKMVAAMDIHPKVGLIQVPPTPVGRESLFARIQQFAGSLYGRAFTAGLSFWQMSESNYWGHNAIIRIAPFIQHCGLPDLPGRAPFGGEILSHDFVEAALMRKAGWEVWLAYDLEESYEEVPPTLIDYAKRDRRWCQGNLQHLGILFAKGLHPFSRLHLLMGIMSYLASPLWLIFLCATALDGHIQTNQETEYFFGNSLFPTWPTYYTVEMTTVFALTLTMLFLPKILSLALIFTRPSLRRQFGGGIKLTLSVLLEILTSMLFAPILMLFQTRFVLSVLLQQNVGWAKQQRDDHETSLYQAIYTHAGHTLFGIFLGGLSYVYVSSFFWWFIPVLVGLILAIPVSIWTSRVSFGRTARRLGLFLIPEETASQPLLNLLQQNLAQEQPEFLKDADVRKSHLALTDPIVHSIHTALLPEAVQDRRSRHNLDGYVLQCLDGGMGSLSDQEMRALLWDKKGIQDLHLQLWRKHAQSTAV